MTIRFGKYVIAYEVAKEEQWTSRYVYVTPLHEEDDWIWFRAVTWAPDKSYLNDNHVHLFGNWYWER